ncbi:nucleotidyltransferase domain-containing protein [Frankia tisae]|uniref:nucleotidyltransferase domain-containing protein n=1 Tax=Frankia tisae TaxID=2950104 RepID=UPI0021BF0681|nr:hypothetical protein [Frankia tisae]
MVADSRYGRWAPAEPGEVAALFADLAGPWWVAGGYAIACAVGRCFRAHDDIDVAVLRRDQLAVQWVLAGWEWWAADPPGVLRRWRPGELLPFGVHDIWCRPGPARPWRIQVMLEEARGGQWECRRDPRVRRPIATLGNVTSDGIPHLAPEVQLLYKAASPRPKDELDLVAALPVLTATQRRWLADALTLAHPGHPWCDRLSPSR